MIFPSSARYNLVMYKANQFLAKENVTSFPIDPYEIILNNKWGLITYTELAEIQNTTVQGIVSTLQSEDGFTIYDEDNYTIAYNDTIQSPGRIRFTLMHEIGHIYLNHLIDFEETILTRSNLSEDKYRVLENEANSFARNTLSPVMVVKSLNLSSISDVADCFGLSLSAAKVRLKALVLDYMTPVPKFVQFQRDYFRPFIEQFLYSRFCIVCAHHFIHPEADYCSVCGNKSLLNKKGVEEMIYTGHYLDENSRALTCPRCENEHLNYTGDFCKVCGANLINKCAPTYTQDESGWNGTEPSCETLLDGDARYCIKCGNESTYLQQGLLKRWSEEHEEAERFEGVPF